MNIDELLRTHTPDPQIAGREARRLRAEVLDAVEISPSRVAALMPKVRRRRVLARTAVAAVLLGTVATGVTLMVDASAPASAAQRRFIEAPPDVAYERYGAFSAGNTVYIGNHQVTFDEKIKALYYTSEGVLVRTGRVAYTDDAGASHYELIRPDGTHHGIDLKMGDRVVGTDPGSPNVAYAEPNGARWDFVVIDLVTGDEIVRTTVDGAFTWGGWEAPPVTMAGHRMWALFDAGWTEYDWQAQKTRLVPGTAQAPLAAAHARFMVDRGRTWQVRDLMTGAAVRDIPLSEEQGEPTPTPSLSPDGRFARLASHFAGYDESGRLIDDPGPYRFWSLASGKVVTIKSEGVLGWTPGGNTLQVDAKSDRLTVCDPGTGSCDEIDLPVSGTGRVKLGGLSYES